MVVGSRPRSWCLFNQIVKQFSTFKSRESSCRSYITTKQPSIRKQIHSQAGKLSSVNVSQTNETVPSAEVLVYPDLNNLYGDIRNALAGTQPELESIAQYYFSGEGKAIRPVITMCMARAVNHHLDSNTVLVSIH